MPLPPDPSENERRGIDLNENGGVDAGFEAWRAYLWLVEGGAAERHAGPEMDLLQKNLLGVFPAEQRVEVYGFSFKWEGKPLDGFPLFVIREALRIFSPQIVEKWAHGAGPNEKPLYLTDSDLGKGLYWYDWNVLQIGTEILLSEDPDYLSQVVTHELWHAWSDFSVPGKAPQSHGFFCSPPAIWEREPESNADIEEEFSGFFSENIFPYLWSDPEELEESIQQFRNCYRQLEARCKPQAPLMTANQKLQFGSYFGFWLYDFGGPDQEWRIPSEIFAHLAARQTAPLWRRLTRAEGLWIGAGRPSLPVLQPLQDWLKILLEENRVESRIAKM